MGTFLYIFLLIIAIPMIALGKKYAPRIIDCLGDIELEESIENNQRTGEFCDEN